MILAIQLKPVPMNVMCNNFEMYHFLNFAYTLKLQWCKSGWYEFFPIYKITGP